LDIRAQMQTDLKEAMKARDSSRVAVLRATLGALATPKPSSRWVASSHSLRQQGRRGRSA
jgi:uncharacterized protein YqeY